MVIIPAIKAHPGTTLEQVFKEFHTYLAENGPMGEVTKEVSKDTDPPAADGQVLDFEKIDYRGNSYLIEERANEVYIVRRTSDNGVLNNQSPTVKAIIRAFREGRK